MWQWVNASDVERFVLGHPSQLCPRVRPLQTTGGRNNFPFLHTCGHVRQPAPPKGHKRMRPVLGREGVCTYDTHTHPPTLMQTKTINSQVWNKCLTKASFARASFPNWRLPLCNCTYYLYEAMAVARAVPALTLLPKVAERIKSQQSVGQRGLHVTREVVQEAVPPATESGGSSQSVTLVWLRARANVCQQCCALGSEGAKTKRSSV